MIDKENTTIVGGAGKKADIQARIAQIKAQVEETTSDYDREKLQERLAKLVGGGAVFRVGGATEIEAKERKERARQQLKHPLALRDGSGAYSAEMAKAARLNSNDLAPSQLMSWQYAKEGAQRLIFDQPLHFGVRTACDQLEASSGLSESCPKNADVPKSPFRCSGSPGAVGRHNNTPNRVAFGCVCHKHPPLPRPRAACGARALIERRKPFKFLQGIQ